MYAIWRQRKIMPIEDGRFIHINPDAVERRSIIKFIELELSAPKVSGFLIEKVNPNRDAWPTLAKKNFLIFSFYKYICNICFIALNL